MNIHHRLLALSALALPAIASAQYWQGPPPPPPAPMPPRPPAATPPRATVETVEEPWMAQQGAAAAPSAQAWQSPMAQPNKGPALEPIDLPPAIEQGVDMIYIDESLVPRAVHNRSFLAGITDAAWSAAPVDLFTSVNPIYTDLRRGLVKYGQSWGSLPQVQVPSGPTLKAGSSGERVAALRTRLGLTEGDAYDAALAARVKDFQSVHGLKADGIAGAGTLDALNRGADYYEQLIIINMERAKRLPAPDEQPKYVVVDAGDARLSMWQNGRKVDEMKVVVGKAETATPMMAAYIKYADVNP